MASATDSAAGDSSASGMLAPRGLALLRPYALVVLVSVGTLLLAREGPIAIILGGAATSAVYLYAFVRLNPRLVGLLLIAMTLAGTLSLHDPPTFWMMGSALGGGVGAILAQRRFEEDDHFFLPALAAAFSTFVLFLVSRPGGWTEGIEIIRNYIADYGREFDVMLSLPQNEDIRREFFRMESWKTFHPMIGLVAVCSLIGLWVLVLWMFNRLARRRAGRIELLGSSLLLFHVRPPYIFLLIAALIFEILGTWLERESLRMISYPLFAVCAVAFVMMYLGLVLFMAAMRRASSPSGLGIGFSLFVSLALALSFYIGPFVGFADVWLDFRKTRQIRDRFS